ncbi:hypothetical protein EJ02DRAFT_455177 [Clathrospora elynae]|uniref:Uncharacterized protein n=1 Tax=Clathrospora elynae TaxID=706981 RepID=A0A6A5SNJ3_9PLEO|nr:hypothetical protein EJ02DRAFT_455177 [Clathrospora elynae]
MAMVETVDRPSYTKRPSCKHPEALASPGVSCSCSHDLPPSAIGLDSDALVLAARPFALVPFGSPGDSKGDPAVCRPCSCWVCVWRPARKMAPGGVCVLVVAFLPTSVRSPCSQDGTIADLRHDHISSVTESLRGRRGLQDLRRCHQLPSHRPGSTLCHCAGKRKPLQRTSGVHASLAPCSVAGSHFHRINATRLAFDLYLTAIFVDLLSDLLHRPDYGKARAIRRADPSLVNGYFHPSIALPPRVLALTKTSVSFERQLSGRRYTVDRFRAPDPAAPPG